MKEGENEDAKKIKTEADLLEEEQIISDQTREYLEKAHGEK